MQSKNSTHIDGHRILKQFGGEDTKMVFLVQSPIGEEQVLKLFTVREAWFFECEVEANSMLSDDHTRVIKMTDFVGYESDKAPFRVNGTILFEYAYILIPFASRGSLIDLLIKANEEEQRLRLNTGL